MATRFHVRRTKADPLTFPIDSLRQALARDYSERQPQWAERVDRALARTEQGLHQNLADGMAPDGSLATIDQTTSSRQVAKLCQTESDLLAQITLLREKIQRAMQCSSPVSPGQARASTVSAPADAISDFASIRDAAAEVLAKVEKIAEAETKLIQESANTDIGVGD